MKQVCLIVLVILNAMSLPGPVLAREGSGHVVFRVADQFGKTVPYQVESCVDSTGHDFRGSFVGLEAAQLPLGTYHYTLGRADVVTSFGKIKGKVDVVSLEYCVTLMADPTLLIGPEAVLAIDRARPTNFVIRGEITPMPGRAGSLWVRLQSTYEPTVAEAKVDASGAFRIYRILEGPCTLSIIGDDGKLLHLEPIIFLPSLSPELLRIKLESLPEVRTVR